MAHSFSILFYICAFGAFFFLSASPNIASAQDGAPQLSKSAPTAPLIMSAGDRLKITVFGDNDLSGEYSINAQGLITMPLIGDISAAGISTSALENNIIDTLSTGILVNPKVSIDVVSVRPFYILGEVNTPGSYPSVPDLDVFKAVAIAGGTTPRAVDDEFIIYRGHGENRQTISAREDTPVLPGDSIRVKERFF